MLDQEMVSSYQQQGTTDVERTGSVDENEREDIDPSTLSLMYSDNMNDVAIKEYINNQGAYSRGEGILHTLTDLFLYGNSRRLHISGHAKGTVSVPYDVSATLKRKGDDKIGKDPLFSAPGLKRNLNCIWKKSSRIVTAHARPASKENANTL